MTAALTLTLGTPVYVVSTDCRRGWGMAVVPPSVNASPFAAHHERLPQHPDGWELTLTCRNQTTGKPWKVDRAPVLKEFGDIYKRLEKRLEPSWSTRNNERRARRTSGMRTG